MRNKMRLIITVIALMILWNIAMAAFIFRAGSGSWMVAQRWELQGMSALMLVATFILATLLFALATNLPLIATLKEVRREYAEEASKAQLASSSSSSSSST